MVLSRRFTLPWLFVAARRTTEPWTIFRPFTFVCHDMRKGKRCRVHSGHLRVYQKPVAVPGWRLIVYLRMHDHKQGPLLHQAGHRETPLFEILRPGSFEIFQIVRIIDDSTTVGVFVIDGDVHHKTSAGNFGNEWSGTPVSFTTTSYSCCTRSVLTGSNP